MKAELDIWVSPLTNRIFIGRTKPDGLSRVANEKKDVTAQCINGAVMHLVEAGETEIVVTLDDKRYRVSITPHRNQP